MLIGSNCSTKALPYFNIMNKHTNIQHEASMFNIDEQVLFYLQTKGLNLVKSQQLIVQNFVGDIIDQLPDEFYLEVKPILDIKIGNNI
jgi:Fe-S cluster assembly protein SufB